MTGEVFEAQENIVIITKQERGFLRPHSSRYYLKDSLEWV